jgi:hypothetical protein
MIDTIEKCVISISYITFSVSYDKASYANFLELPVFCI